MKLTATRLKEVIKYFPETGEMFWINPQAKNIGFGTSAGTLNAYGYVQITIDRVIYRRARLAWLYMTGEWPAGVIDHIDRNRQNDRWSNLRDTSQTLNRHNSSARGITWCRRDKKWIAKIKHYGISTYLGRFATEEEAIAAYQAAKSRYLP